MNKIMYAFNRCKLSFIVASFCLFVCATINANTTSLDHASIENRILSLPTSIDAKYSDHVRKRVKQYTVSQRSASETLLGRSVLRVFH